MCLANCYSLRESFHSILNSYHHARVGIARETWLHQATNLTISQQTILILYSVSNNPPITLNKHINFFNHTWSGLIIWMLPTFNARTALKLHAIVILPQS